MLKKASPEALALLKAAQKEAESFHGNFGSVYLPNIEHGMTRHQFAGYLSALEGAGLYQSCPEGSGFGYFSMEALEDAPEQAPEALEVAPSLEVEALGEWEPCQEDPEALKKDAELLSLPEGTSRKTRQAVARYGLKVCREAFKLHKQGEGAATVGAYLGLKTRQADAAISAGEELASLEDALLDALEAEDEGAKDAPQKAYFRLARGTSCQWPRSLKELAAKMEAVGVDNARQEAAGLWQGFKKKGAAWKLYGHLGCLEAEIFKP